MINKERITEEFLELAAIESPSYGERAMTDRLLEKLRQIGFEAKEDDAASVIGGTAGNIHAYLPGTLQEEPICFAAHTDTVEPVAGKNPVLSEDGIITSSTETVLGGDDICGIVEILEGVRHLREENIPHRPVEVIIAAAEEVYGKGANVLDYSKVKAKEIYVLDQSGAVGNAAISAPSLISFEVIVQGLASHAGSAPEKGIHAIDIAAKAISELQLGHIDADTTVNIGTISGGEADNIIPEQCRITGEVRSMDHPKACLAVENVRKVFEEQCEKYKVAYDRKDSVPKIRFQKEEHLISYHVTEDHPVVIRFQRACAKLGLAGKTEETLGGSDNNIFMQHGFTGVVLTCGMERIHSKEEYTTVSELVHGAQLVAALLTERD